MAFFWVGIGSALGGVLRFLLSHIIDNRYSGAFPWATLTVNTVGSFLIGFFATFLDSQGQLFNSAYGRHFVIVGLLGGFTTFSTFSLQTLDLAREGDWNKAFLNAFSSLLLCLIAVFFGHWLGRESHE